MQRARTVSGGASAAKEPGHFEVRTSSSRSPRCIFSLKKVDDRFLAVAFKTQAANAADNADIVSLSK